MSWRAMDKYPHTIVSSLYIQKYVFFLIFIIFSFIIYYISNHLLYLDTFEWILTKKKLNKSNYRKKKFQFFLMTSQSNLFGLCEWKKYYLKKTTSNNGIMSEVIRNWWFVTSWLKKIAQEEFIISLRLCVKKQRFVWFCCAIFFPHDFNLTHSTVINKY